MSPFKKINKLSDLDSKKVLVVGAGASGISAVRLAQRYNADVTLNDINPNIKCEKDIKCVLGSHPEELFLSSDLIIVSPGVPPIPPILKAEKLGINVISEVELALLGIKAPIIAVTGTNGKSTTVSLIGELLKTIHPKAFCGGNLGTPVSSIVNTESSTLPMVLELSSFQLERTPSLKPKIALLLNITEDHLDRYDAFEDYVYAKLNIFKNQKGHDHAILNYDDPIIIQYTKDIKATKWFFSSLNTDTPDFIITDNHLEFKPFNYILPKDSVLLPGRHNLENVLAAVAAALLIGVNPKNIEPVVKSFKGLPHRMEYVDTVRRVSFYNDSKATNVGSVVGSLKGFDGKIILIAGGRHKGASYTPLRDILELRTRGIVLLGESAPLIKKDLKGIAPIFRAYSMIEAVRLAYQMALPGDSVVLSPACSSYDMFKNYKERGNAFKNAVRLIKKMEGQ